MTGGSTPMLCHNGSVVKWDHICLSSRGREIETLQSRQKLGHYPVGERFIRNEAARIRLPVVAPKYAGEAITEWHQPSKLEIAGSIPVTRSK